jgi:hypothetical protein
MGLPGDESPPVVHLHEEACETAESAGFSPEVLARIFVNSWLQLRTTRGSKMRRLSGLPGNNWRMRIASYRCVVSLAKSRTGSLHAFIHQFEKRADVYETDAFSERIRQFWRSVDDGSVVPESVSLLRNYVEVDPAAAKAEDLPRATLHHELKPKQREFSELVLPIRASARQMRSQIVIGHGPPGSGKTVVAQDLVLEAVHDGLKIDVLVPSAPLKAEYRRLFAAYGLRIAESTTDEGEVRLLEFPEHFAMLAGRSIDHARERRVREWWNAQIADPRFRARLGGAAVEELHGRLPLLVDAILGDEDFWKRWPETRTAKDFMGDQVRECIETFQGLREHLEVCAPSGEPLPTRASLAVEAFNRARSSEPPPGDRLILVDEAQDLAPAECRALLTFWLKTGASDPHAIRELVFLGDQEQRISLIPFSWDELKQAAVRLTDIKPNQIREQEVDSASYRMRRTIGRVARTVWDPRVRGPGKFKQQGKFDINRLDEGGTVDVVVTSTPVNLGKLADECMRHTAPGEHLFMVRGAAAVLPAESSRIFSYHVRQAKGLEASRVVVAHPFGHPTNRRSRPVLPPDDVMAFYVAASRAREHLLLVLDGPSWKELERCSEPWKLPGVHVHHAASTTTDLEHLLRQCVVSLSEEELRQTLLGQLATRCQTNETGAPIDIDGIVRIVTRLCEIRDPDMIETLLANSNILARYNATALQELWIRGSDSYRAGNLVVSTAILLLAGESGAAFRVAAAAAESGIDGWDLTLLELLADESKVQAIRRSQELDQLLRESSTGLICRRTTQWATNRMREAVRSIEELRSR